jgi:hypothetical protein
VIYLIAVKIKYYSGEAAQAYPPAGFHPEIACDIKTKTNFTEGRPYLAMLNVTEGALPVSSLISQAGVIKFKLPSLPLPVNIKSTRLGHEVILNLYLPLFL